MERDRTSAAPRYSLDTQSRPPTHQPKAALGTTSRPDELRRIGWLLRGLGDHHGDAFAHAPHPVHGQGRAWCRGMGGENRFPGRADSASTLATHAYELLRSAIPNGAIAPGARLHIRDQCLRLGIGLSPMREALNRLSAQGFVVQSDQRGFTAAPLDSSTWRTSPSRGPR
jgi:hypothetical protein